VRQLRQPIVTCSLQVLPTVILEMLMEPDQVRLKRLLVTCLVHQGIPGDVMRLLLVKHHQTGPLPLLVALGCFLSRVNFRFQISGKFTVSLSK
jgi:hypothetical protein